MACCESANSKLHHAITLILALSFILYVDARNGASHSRMHKRKMAQGAATPPTATDSSPPSPQPPIVLQTTNLSRCFGIRGPHCSDYYTQDFVELQPPKVHSKQCPNNCSGKGVCNGETGLCDCPAGVGGPDCGSADPRPCTNTYRNNKKSNISESHIGPNKRDTNWAESGWTPSRCAGVCDDTTAICYCDGPHHGRVPAPDGSPPGSPPIRPGRLLHGKCQRLSTDDKGQPLGWGSRNCMSYDDIYGAQGWCTVDTPRVRCSCDIDGVDGELCDLITEMVCPNQCSGHGLCNRGFCNCLPGWYGLDCARISDQAAALSPIAASSSSSSEVGGDQKAAAAEGSDQGEQVTAAAAGAGLPPYQQLVKDRAHYIGNLVVDVWAAAAGQVAPAAATATSAAAAGQQQAPPIPQIYFTPLSADKAESSEAAAAAAAAAGAVGDVEEKSREAADARNRGADAGTESNKSNTKSNIVDSNRSNKVTTSDQTRSAAADQQQQQPSQRRLEQQQQQSNSGSSSKGRSLLRHMWTGGGRRRDIYRWAPTQQQVTAAVQAWLASSTAAAASSCSTLHECLVAAGVAMDRLTSDLDVQVLQQMVETGMTEVPQGRTRRPRIFVYDMPSRFVGRLLQYRPSKQTCSWRIFSKSNFTLYTTSNAESSWRYPLESHLHELMLQSPHRTLNPEEADFFYVPVYASCFMEAVAGWADAPWWNVHSRSHIKQGVSMYLDALNWIRTTYPYWNATKGSNHIWLFAHDEGACWAPEEIYNRSIMLSQWGRMSHAVPQDGGISMTTSSTSRWEYNYNKADDKDDPAMPEGFMKAIGSHPCYTPSKDLVLPAFKPPPLYHASPFVGGDSRRTRDILLLLRGDLGAHRGPDFSGGLRQTLAKLAKAGNWKARHGIWIGTERELEGDQSVLLSRSRYCLVVPRDGWSGLFEDAVLHGCIPVVVTGPSGSASGGIAAGGIAQPFSALVRLSSAMVKVTPDDLPALPRILRDVTLLEEEEMRANLGKIWHRMAWLSHPWVENHLTALVRDNLRKHPWVQEDLDSQRLQQQSAHQHMGRQSFFAAEAAAAAAAEADSSNSNSEVLVPPIIDLTASPEPDGGSSNGTMPGQQIPELFDMQVWDANQGADDAFATLMQWLHYKTLHPYDPNAVKGSRPRHVRPTANQAAVITD